MTTYTLDITYGYAKEYNPDTASVDGYPPWANEPKGAGPCRYQPSRASEPRRANDQRQRTPCPRRAASPRQGYRHSPARPGRAGTGKTGWDGCGGQTDRQAGRWKLLVSPGVIGRAARAASKGLPSWPIEQGPPQRIPYPSIPVVQGAARHRDAASAAMRVQRVCNASTRSDWPARVRLARAGKPGG